MNKKLVVPHEALAEFCRKWRIVELALFGSALRDDFASTSDIDVLATFAADAGWSLFEFNAMREELAVLFGRDVDLVSRRGLERSRNYLRREAILNSLEILYAA